MSQSDEQAYSHRRPKQRAPGHHQLTIQQWSDVCRTMKMSLREQQVCELLFDGLTRQKIAEEMDISIRGVRHHMEQIHMKLNACNRVGVVLRIIQLRDLLQSTPLISTQVRPSTSKDPMAQLNAAKQSKA